MSNQIIGIIISAIFGLIIGSLLNVVILRFDVLKTIINTRSHCPKCKKEIAWFDLIPFISYVALLGKCRNCKGKISIQYPLVEVGTGAIFGLLFWKFGLSVEFFTLLIISSILVVVFVYDILHYLIADILVWIAIGIWILYLIISYFFLNSTFDFLLSSLYGGLALGGFLALLVVLSREKWMGAGDIKLGFLLGMVASWPDVLVAAFLAYVLGSIVGLLMIALSKKTLKDQIPFAPFLITGTLIALFYGNQIIIWYFRILGY